MNKLTVVEKMYLCLYLVLWVLKLIFNVNSCTHEKTKQYFPQMCDSHSWEYLEEYLFFFSFRVQFTASYKNFVVVHFGSVVLCLCEISCPHYLAFLHLHMYKREQLLSAGILCTHSYSHSGGLVLKHTATLWKSRRIHGQYRNLLLNI